MTEHACAATLLAERRGAGRPRGDCAAKVQLLDAACAGSDAAYAELVAPHRDVLQAHCYRMLGSVHDAEDAVQETLLRAWRKLASFQGRSTFRSWLHVIATNVCLRVIERRPRRVLPPEHGPAADPQRPLLAPLAETTWIDPLPDDGLALPDGLAGPEARYEQRESVELAFVAALQHLPPRQRAVLVLRDVLGFSGAEVAMALGTTPASVYSALQRAHDSVDRRLPRQSQQATLRALGDDRLRAIVDRYVEAWEQHDVDAIVALLTDDVTLAMPPTPSWYGGRDAVAEGLRTWPLAGRSRWRLTPAAANAQPAVVAHRWDAGRGAFVAHHLAVITLRGSLISGIVAFHQTALSPVVSPRWSRPK